MKVKMIPDVSSFGEWMQVQSTDDQGTILVTVGDNATSGVSIMVSREMWDMAKTFFGTPMQGLFHRD